MAIAFDNASTGNITSTGNSLTFSLTVGSGSNRILWVGALVNTTTATVTSVTYAGVAMTATAASPLRSNQSLILYYLAAPASGANNIVLTLSSNVSEIHGIAASYTGAAQTGLPDSSVTESAGSGTSATLTTTTVANNAWMVGLFRNDSTGNGSASTGTTQRAFDSGQVSFDDSGAPLTPAGSHSIRETWTGSANNYVLGASFAPFVATVTTGDFLPFF